MNPQNTVFDAKRLIGRKFTDPSVQDDIKHWPFKVVDGPDHKPLIEGEHHLSLQECILGEECILKEPVARAALQAICDCPIYL